MDRGTGLHRLPSGRLIGLGIAACIALVASLAAPAVTHAQAPAKDDPWPDLIVNVFDGKAIAESPDIIRLDAPTRAEDAALVPITIAMTPPAGQSVKRVTLVVDENPAPVAAVFELGSKAQVAEISTRVRVNAYTNVHAVAELDDGSLHMAVAYVKASGGCSAPAGKDPDEALASLGKMKFRQFPAKDKAAANMTPLREAQLLMRHPNNSGLQMDQITHLYIPPRFVQDLKILQGDELILRVEGGISISEDPNFRFTFRPNGAKTFRVEAIDTDNAVFSGEWPVQDAGS